MPASFDRDAEDAKLAAIHQEEAEDLTQILADKFSLPYIDLSITPINMDALRIIPEAESREAEAVAYDKNGRHLSVAMRNPETDAYRALKQRLEQAEYILSEGLASERGINLALARYEDLSSAHADDRGVFSESAEKIQSIRALGGVSAFTGYLQTFLEQKPAPSPTRILEEVVAGALALNASDIHFEPEDDAVRMRFRLNGILTESGTFTERAYHVLNSRIKVLSGLKLNVTDRAQDGRFTIELGSGSDVTAIEIRVSAIPGNFGESIVMRVLDPAAAGRDFRKMGMEPRLMERLAKEIRRPNGMLLTTGPTGSGKTTTLYAFLREIHTPDIKIITLEDPVEYRLEGVVQTQVRASGHAQDEHTTHKELEQEYTFASGLRSILRQDPDVIMVGEIRDAEVADVAVQAALTGHFVFSTLHTNDAAGAFPRLVDLGVDPKEFGSAVSVVMAQRLVRTLDPTTRVERATTSEEKALIERVLAQLPPEYDRPENIDRVYVPNPELPEGEGYNGRTGVFEALFMDNELGTYLRDNPSSSDIQKYITKQGYLTLAQDAVLKVLRGETSLEEVQRVVDLGR